MDDHPKGFETYRKKILEEAKEALGKDECLSTFLDLMVKRGDLLPKTAEEVYQRRGGLFDDESFMSFFVQLALDGLGTIVEDELTEKILDFVFDGKIEDDIEWSDDGAPDTHPHLRE